MDKKLCLTLILVRTMYSGMQILAKAAFNGGMNAFVFAFYRQALATIFLAPMAIISVRKGAPPLSFKIMCKMFVLAFGITLTTDLYNAALGYTSATVVAAMLNTVPVITFGLSVLLRMETVKMKSLSGVAKVLGVALCLSGVMAVAFYRGPSLKSLNHHDLLLGQKRIAAHKSGSPSSETWVKGCFLMLLGSTGWSLWFVLQGGILREFPSKLLFTAFQCVFSAIQCFFVAFLLERDFTRWKLGPDVRLASVAYCGIIVTGVSFYLQSWCIERAGPVVVAMWTPLTFVVTTSFSSFVLGETISTGSVIGGVLMVGGLYSVLSGKSKEQVYSRRLPISREDGKENLQMKQMPSPQDEPTKASNLDSSDSKCQTDQKI